MSFTRHQHTWPHVGTVWFLLPAIMAFLSCNGSRQEPPPDHPRLASDVKMLDVTFHSAALHRDMQYRAVMPADAGQKYPVLYLLHGGGGGFRDWSNYTDIAGDAARGLILVMPEGNSSYYMNSSEHPYDRYEDYVVRDLIADVEKRLPALGGRANRAIAGISMGGFGAVVLALKHPGLYIFAGGLSPALDVPSRPFSIKRIGQWRQHSAIFGSWGSQSRKENDPLTLARTLDPANAPYIFLTCGDQEGLLAINRKFSALLKQKNFHYEFHTVRGGHDWNQWDQRVPGLMESLMQHLSKG